MAPTCLPTCCTNGHGSQKPVPDSSYDRGCETLRKSPTDPISGNVWGPREPGPASPSRPQPCPGHTADHFSFTGPLGCRTEVSHLHVSAPAVSPTNRTPSLPYSRLH